VLGFWFGCAVTCACLGLDVCACGCIIYKHVWASILVHVWMRVHVHVCIKSLDCGEGLHVFVHD